MTKEQVIEIDPTLDRYFHALSSVCLNQRLAYYMAVHDYKRLRDTLMQSRIHDRWDTDDKTKMEERLNWFLTQGRRADFDRDRYHLATLGSTNRTKYMESLKRGELRTTRLWIVNTYANRLPAAGIAAFDYAWYLIICRAAMGDSQSSNAVALERMLLIAQRIQQSYSSWEEYFLAYACGNQYDEIGSKKSTSTATEAHIFKLLTGKYSPIRQFDWDFDLNAYQAAPTESHTTSFGS